MRKGLQKNWIIAGVISGLVLLSGSYVFLSRKPQLPVAPVVHEPLKIGGIVPLTGSRSAYGIPLQRAAQLAVDEINKKGGVFGEQIQILWEDGKCSPTAAKTATQKLVTKSKVQVIIGGVCSQETLAAAPITEAAKVLLISPASTSAEITKAGDFVFRLTQSDALSGEVTANYLSNVLNAKKVSIVRENTAYINGIAESFIDTFTKNGGEVIYNQSYKTGARGSGLFASEAAKAGPDIIYLLPDSPTQGLQQLERLKQNGVTIPVIVDEVLLDRATIKANPDFFEGVYGVESYFDAGSPRAKKFLGAYKDQYAEDPKFPYYMANMYDAVYIIRDAAEKVGTKTEDMKNWLLGVKRWPGVAGDVTFDEFGDYRAKFSIIKVKNGEAEFQQVMDTVK